MIIFVDTSALISLFNLTEENHYKAIKIAQDLKKASFMISNFVFSEVATILSQRTNKKTAIGVGELIKHTYIWMEIKRDIEDQAWEIFKSQSSKNVSFTDCTTFALFKNKVFDKAFSFDQDFKKNQIPVLE